MKISRRSISLISSILVTFGLSTAVALAQNGSFTIEQVLSAPFASSPLAAPSGTKVAWLLNERGQRNVWIANAPDWKGRKVTNFNQDDGQEIAELSWAPDGSYLLFTRGGDFETGGDNPNPDLSPAKPEQDIWVVGMNGSAPRKLTEGHAPAVSPKGDWVAFLRAGQIFLMKPNGQDVTAAVTQKATTSNLTWSPDGSVLAFVSARKDHGFIGLYTPANKNLQYLDASTNFDSDPVWSRDGTHIAYIRTPSGDRNYFMVRRQGEPWSIRITDVKTGSSREVFRADRGPGSVFHNLDAEQQLYWGSGGELVFPWEKTGWCHLYSLQPTGNATPVELTPGDGIVEHAAMSHDGNTMFYSTNIGDIDRRHISSVPAAGGSAPEPVTHGENIEWQPAPVADGSAVVFLASSYNEVAHAVVRTAAGQFEALAPQATPSQFPAKLLVKPQQVILTASDGLQIHGQLFLPAQSTTANSAERHPALIFFHGGSRREMLLGFHYMNYYSNAYAMNQYLASQGYVVLSVNYRSGIGYGLNFREAINYGPHGASEFNDVMGAGLYLKSRPDVDPKRIGVWGGSYGGYLTALALSRASDLFAAGVDFHGVHDWSTLRDSGAPRAAGDPKEQDQEKEAAQLAFESSPMAAIKTWRSPVLLIQGDDDRNVAFSQTVTLAGALRQQHVEFEELIFPNEIHDFLLHRHWIQAYTATAEFFAKKLRENAPVEASR